MTELDLLIRNGQVFCENDLQKVNIAVKDGRIVDIGSSLTEDAGKIIDCNNNIVLPGCLDVHTHMGIPIMDTSSADNFESGTAAAACGGVTTIFDFTVQSPGQTLWESLRQRQKLAQEKCHIDYHFHVNITDQPEKRLDEIPPLIEQGYFSFKVFTTYPGMRIDSTQMRMVMETIKRHDGVLLVHPEDDQMVTQATKANIAAENYAAKYHPLSRTAEAEAKAIADTAAIALELDAKLYIVHLSSEAGLNAALKARKQGAKIFIETCPQYLLLDDSYYDRSDGHRFITTPPLRPRENCEALWQALSRGDIDVIGTDHCPFTKEQKELGQKQFQRTPNGLPGVETIFPLLYTHGVAQNRISLKKLVEVTASNPARIFGIAERKGRIKIGADADFIIWDEKKSKTITATENKGNADWSPFEGVQLAGSLEYTISRGRIIYHRGNFHGQKQGQQIPRKLRRVIK